jgi:hypothetical protein
MRAMASGVELAGTRENGPRGHQLTQEKYRQKEGKMASSPRQKTEAEVAQG